jgi:YfiH family protein
VITHPAWRAHAGLLHGFLDRTDSEAAAGGDWQRALGRVGVSLPIATVRQVHGTDVATADDAGTEADAVVAGRRGIAVGIVTADCVPALLVAPRAGAVAAVHAGWRGAAAGVLEAALARLRADFGIPPADVEAVLGPAIGPCCYRVGPEVEAAFVARSGKTTAAAWRRDGEHLLLDMRLAARLLLAAAGVGGVESVGPCTACTPSLASYRRDGAGAGRQLSFVGWAA